MYLPEKEFIALFSYNFRDCLNTVAGWLEDKKQFMIYNVLCLFYMQKISFSVDGGFRLRY